MEYFDQKLTDWQRNAAGLSAMARAAVDNGWFELAKRIQQQAEEYYRGSRAMYEVYYCDWE